MKRLLLAVGILLTAVLGRSDVQSIETGWRNPPASSRPHAYWLWLNGYVNMEEAKAELRAMKDAGFSGVLMFDMGARGTANAQPPAGPAFLSPPWMKQFHEAVDYAKQLKLQFDFSVVSSWDLGGSWIEPRHGSMAIFAAETTVNGGAVDTVLPMPPIPPAAPKRADGQPVFQKDVAVLAVRNAVRQPGHEFVWSLDPPGVHVVKEAVLDNGDPRASAALATTMTPVREFAVSVSESGTREADFREVVRGELPAANGPKHFPLPAGTRARYVRLVLLSGHDASRPRWTLGEFSLFDDKGENVASARVANRARSGALVVRAATALGHDREWSIENLNNGTAQGARGVFSTAGLPAFTFRDRKELVDVTSKVDSSGRLRWDAPAGKWTILRYVCLNTGEMLKVPSPASDGLATDHLNPDATRAHMDYVFARLKESFGDLKQSGLTNVYLASYEVRGPIWSPTFTDEFRKRRGYDMKPFLPALFGARVGADDQTERFIFDYRKTLGEVLVDNYYKVANDAAHANGLFSKSEAGGPGPPVHNVPVESISAHVALDAIQGEFWPYWPEADAMWVVKEPASAAHVYGRSVVNLESFTSTEHWREGPGDLKNSADRVFAEGGNHIVWHTWTHNAPEAGLPGWVYLAGTHINRNVTWWPKAKPFIDYLSRSSYMLQQGKFVADVLYYYGDGGYKFIGPKKKDASLGRGYDYDVTNSDAILNRLTVKDGRLVLPDGMSYSVLVLPESDEVNPAVLGKIEQLVRAGATVIGPRPARAHGLEGFPASDVSVRSIAAKMWGDLDGKAKTSRAYGKGHVMWGQEIHGVLASMKIGPDFTAPEPFDYIHRRVGTADIYFVRNPTGAPIKGKLGFRETGRELEQWDAVTGRIEAVASREPVVELPANGSLFFVIHNPIGGKRKVTPAPEVIATQTLEGDWKVDFQAGRGAPASITMPALASWTNHTDPGVRYFSGNAKYTKRFTLPAGWGSKVRLDLGRLWSVGDVTLNGKPLGVLWTPPYAVDLSPALRRGENELVVEVTNTWFNRLVGDAKLPEGQRITRTNTPASGSKGWGLLEVIESGLLGPVKLERLK